MRTYVEAIEYFLPEKVVSNADLVSENPKWNLEEKRLTKKELRRR